MSGMAFEPIRQSPCVYLKAASCPLAVFLMATGQTAKAVLVPGNCKLHKGQTIQLRSMRKSSRLLQGNSI